MKYYKVTFISSSGNSVNGFYTKSKNKNITLNLDHNREILVSEDLIKSIMDTFDVDSIVYAGKTHTKELE